MNDEPTQLSIPVPVLMDLISHAGYLMGLVEVLSPSHWDEDQLAEFIEKHDHIMQDVINAI